MNSSRNIGLTALMAVSIMMVALLLPSSTVQAAPTSMTLISVAPGGDALGTVSITNGISSDGRYIVYQSNADDLVVDDTNGVDDIFVYDTQTNTTERVSVATDGSEGTLESTDAYISADGRYVAFLTQSALAAGDSNGATDVYVRDTVDNTTIWVSVNVDDLPHNGTFTGRATISDNGQFVAFSSDASDLVAGDTNGADDVFVRDIVNGVTERVSIASNDAQGNSGSFTPSISADGRYVTFTSSSSNLVVDDNNGFSDIFLRDRQTGTTTRLSVASDGTEANNLSDLSSITSDGRYVVFTSSASNLVVDDTNNATDIFLRDTVNNTTERVSLGSGGIESSNGVPAFPLAAISDDGRYIAFPSSSPDLVIGGTSGGQLFRYDRVNSVTELVSAALNGEQGNNSSSSPAISADGSLVAFTSDANNLTDDETNGTTQVYLAEVGIVRGNSYETFYETPLTVNAADGVLANDTANTATAANGSTAEGGSYNLSADGSFTYTPPQGFFGEDSFTYSATDGTETDIALVTVTVPNRAPITADDIYFNEVNTQLTVNPPGVLVNDSDPDGLTITALALTNQSTSNGTVSLDADGSFIYDPTTDFIGADSFLYVISDGVNDATGTVTINVTELGAYDDSYTTNFETQLTVPAPGVLFNDAGLTSVTAIAAGATAEGGTITLNADGSFTYDPPTGFFGGPDSFVYTATDGSNTDTATVTITIPNETPVANPDEYTAIVNTPLPVLAANGVLANDTDLEGQPLNATAIVDGTTAQGGSISLNTNGSFTYGPNTNFNGEDSFAYVVSDGVSSTTGTVTINVRTNAAPVAVDDSYDVIVGDSIDEAAPGVLGNDTDADGDDMIAVLVSNVTQGTLTLNQDGSFSYTPNLNATGTDSFTYVASDGFADAPPATVTINLEVLQDTGSPSELVTDADNYTTVPTYPIFGFVGVENPNTYRLYVSDGVSAVIDATFTPAQICSGLLCEIDSTDSLPNWGLLDGEFQWWVGAIFANGNQTWSGGENFAPAEFTVGMPSAALPQLTIDERSGRPLVTWVDDPNTLWVNLWLGPAGSSTFFEWVERDGDPLDMIPDFTCVDGTCSFDPEWDAPGGTYQAWMQAWGPGGFSEGGSEPAAPGWASADFSLPTTPPDMTDIDGTVLFGGAVDGDLLFTWDGSPVATWYHFYITTPDPEFALIYGSPATWFSAADLNCDSGAAGTCELVLEGVESDVTLNETYTLWIRAYGPGGFSTGGLGGGEWLGFDFTYANG